LLFILNFICCSSGVCMQEPHPCLQEDPRGPDPTAGVWDAGS